MPLTRGVCLGSYEIREPLGAGGMGEVCRAHDTKLGREVAIKVLPATFALDAERVARFKREAQVLVSLTADRCRRGFAQAAALFECDLWCYSVLSASIGSRRPARRAGRRPAAAETAASSTIVDVAINGSRAWIPYS